jgi:hypothetical protein
MKTIQKIQKQKQNKINSCYGEIAEFYSEYLMYCYNF